MKKIVCLILSCFVLLAVKAQVPHQINYQGIARNSVGNALPNQSITVKISIRDGSATGTVVYSETRTVLTNAFGLFFYGIGSPGATAVNGSLSTVNWATGNKFLQVEIDPKGGSSFSDTGTTQLLSVPYAFYAAGASPTGVAGGSLTGTYPNPVIANGAITLPMIAPGVLPTTLPPSGPAGGSLAGTYPNPSIANGAVQQAMIAPGVTLPPNGPAGGSLTGTYPNPSIANGAVLQAMIAPGVTLPPNGPAGGDLSGSYPNPTVSKIMGRSINNTVPVLNNVLAFDGTNWGPVDLGSISDNLWASNGTNIHNINTGNVGVGTNNPSYKFQVAGGDAHFSDSVIAGSIRAGSPGSQRGISVTGNFGLYSIGNTTGVYAKGNSYGVLAEGNNYGVWGSSVNGRGVLAQSVDKEGVYAEGKTGVYGSGPTYGIHGSSTGGTGVYGSGPNNGVSGSSAGAGVRGFSETNFGVYGYSYDGIGTYGNSINEPAVVGYSTNDNGGYFVSVNNSALWATTSRVDNNWAGVFEGNVYTFNAYQTSDKNLKKNITEVENAIGILKLLKPKTYEFRDDGKLANLHLPKGQHYGVLAQDLEEVLPRLVSELKTPLTPPIKMEKNSNGEEYAVLTKATDHVTLKAVNYTGLIPIMIKGMQEQQHIIENQNERITTLEARIARLEALLSTRTKSD